MDQFMILLKRTYRERCRDYFDTIRLVQALAIAILLGLLWWKSNCRTEAQLRDQAITKVPIFFFVHFCSVLDHIYISKKK